MAFEDNFNLQDLRDELDNDPVGMTYPQEISAVQALINDPTKRSVANTEPVPTSTIFAKFDPTAYAGVVAAGGNNLQMLTHILGMGTVDPSDTNLAQALTLIFGTGSDTINALIPLRTKKVSRAKELGWPRIMGADIAAARAL
jgi:ribulose kinase